MSQLTTIEQIEEWYYEICFADVDFTHWDKFGELLEKLKEELGDE